MSKTKVVSRTRKIDVEELLGIVTSLAYGPRHTCHFCIAESWYGIKHSSACLVGRAQDALAPGKEPRKGPC